MTKITRQLNNYFYKIYCSHFKYFFDRKKTKIVNAKFCQIAKETNYENKKINLKSIRKVAIIACFFEDGTIPDYLLYYIDKLKLLYDAIILIADSPILDKELTKVKNRVLYASFSRHCQYDFGSYKIGFQYLLDNNIANTLDSILLTNDSCYGPIYNLVDAHNIMNRKNVDFWGLTQNNEYKNHIQSYFIVINKRVITSKYFKKFISSVKKQKYYLDIVKKYEIGFTRYLAKKKFTYDTFVNKDFNYGEAYRHTNKTLFPYDLVRYSKMPLVKIKEFSQYYKYCDQRVPVLNLIKNDNFELYSLIIKNLASRKLI